MRNYIVAFTTPDGKDRAVSLRHANETTALATEAAKQFGKCTVVYLHADLFPIDYPTALAYADAVLTVPSDWSKTRLTYVLREIKRDVLRDDRERVYRQGITR